jgi:spore maturation protein CgeB
MNIVITGLSITSSWGNGHATTYRSLVNGLAARGHRTLFLERDVPWYAQNRDLPNPPGVRTALYSSTDQLFSTYERQVREADLVMVGSFVPEGVAVGEWVLEKAQGVTAFYDIDTPVTLERLGSGQCEYLAASQIARYGLYLSFTGGPTLKEIERRFGSPCARALYCSVDPALYRPRAMEPRWDMGYLGTWSEDRQPGLEELMLRPARHWHRGAFCVAGPLYPDNIRWPVNVERVVHLSPGRHARFYNSQRFTLNVTRAAMKRAGFSPSVRLFEAAACGVPIVSDWWPGLDSILEPGREILIATNADDTLRYLRDWSEAARMAVGLAARERVLREHTSERRAIDLEQHVAAVINKAVPA